MAACKVLLVVRPAEGGMKAHVQALLGKLNRHLFQLALVCPAGSSLAAFAAAEGIPVYPLAISSVLSPWQDVLAVSQLRGIIKQVQPALLHAHGVKAGLLTRLACGTLRQRPAVVLTAHNFVYSGSIQGWQKKALLGVDKLLDAQTECYITVSEGLRKELLQELGIAPHKVKTVYNGLDLERFTLPVNRTEVECFQRLQKERRRKLGLKAEQPVVGTVARLAPQKGIRYFLEMAAHVQTYFPTVQYLIVGDGPLFATLVQQTAELGISGQVKFVGYSNEIPDLLTAMDLFVLPSLSEGLGISVLEALAAQLPVIATAVGGIPEVITQGVNGLLVPTQDAKCLAAEVITLLGQPAYARRLAQTGFAQVLANFSLPQMIAQTEQIYQEVLLNPQEESLFAKAKVFI